MKKEIVVYETSAPGIPMERKRIPEGCYIHEIVKGIRGPFIVVISGSPVLRKDWGDRVYVDMIIVRFPLGGEGSSPGRLVAMIGVIALSMWAPGAMGLIGFKAALMSSAIMMGGSLLVNALMPIKLPPDSLTKSGNNVNSYSLGRPQNVARLGEVIPVQYGRVKTTPALISQPWKEYVANEEYVHILLCLGWGEYEIEQLRFDTLDFSMVPTEDLEYSILGPGETVPYHDNMFTSPAVSDYEMKNTFGEYTSPSLDFNFHDYVFDGTAIWDAVDVTCPTLEVWQELKDEIGNVFMTANLEMVFNGSIVNTGIFTAIGSTPVDPPSYPYVLRIWTIDPLMQEETVVGGTLSLHKKGMGYTSRYPTDYPGSVIPYEKTVYCDINFPSGLYYMENDGSMSSASVKYGIVYQTISPTGVLGLVETLLSPVTISSKSSDITAGNRSPRRVTISATLPSEVVAGSGNKILIGLIQEDPEAPDNRRVNQAYWVGLRVLYDDIGSYEGLTTIAIRAKASAGMKGDALSRVSAISTRKLPIWNDDSDGWSEPTPTQEIAWAVADCCMNEQYSMGLSEDLIDLPVLLELHDIWESRGDKCNGVFESRTAFWDSLEMILRTGRASRNTVAGIITFYRDQPVELDRAVFTLANIERGSFRIDVMLYDPETPDDVEVEYLDSNTWKWEKTLCSLPNSDSEAPATIKKWGITDQQQAYREGIHEAACNMYRRVMVTFRTELDGRVLLRGQRISVSYPLPSWGVSGFIRNVDSSSEGTFITLSEPVEFETGQSGYLSFRNPTGGFEGPYMVDDTGNPFEVEWLESEGVPDYVSELEEGRVSFQFGTANDNADVKCIVLYAKPLTGNKAEIYCVKEDDRVHNIVPGT